MKDIYIIAAYTPTKHKEDTLRDLVRSIRKHKRNILLITHSNTPQDIIDDVNYYFYDSDNKLIDDIDLMGMAYVETGGMRVWSKYFSNPSYMLGAYRLFLNGLSISKMLGYDIAHYIEYDAVVKNVDVFDNNNNRLIEHDAVVYDYTYNDNTSMIGHSLSINLNRYSYDDIKYDENGIKYRYIDSFYPMVEQLTYNTYIKNRNHIHVDIDELSNSLDFDMVKSHLSPRIFITPIKFTDDQMSIFLWSKDIDPSPIMIIINDSSIINMTAESHRWAITNIGGYTDVKKIEIYINGSFKTTFDMSTDDKRDKIMSNVRIDR